MIVYDILNVAILCLMRFGQLMHTSSLLMCVVAYYVDVFWFRVTAFVSLYAVCLSSFVPSNVLLHVGLTCSPSGWVCVCAANLLSLHPV